MSDIFDLFGEAQAAAKMDAYLEHMERVFRLKKSAIEAGEDKYADQMAALLVKLVELTTLEASKAIDQLKEAEAES